MTKTNVWNLEIVICLIFGIFFVLISTSVLVPEGSSAQLILLQFLQP